MPYDLKWADFFSQTVSAIASHFKNFPEINRNELEAIEDRLNGVWIDPQGTWPEFQRVVGEYKMFFWKAKNAKS